MLSGRSTVVAARGVEAPEIVLAACRRRFGLADDGTTMELWHGSERVPADESVSDWPGIQPDSGISEYQLVVGR
eukprot:2772191-Amphidinium_carterae.1